MEDLNNALRDAVKLSVGIIGCGNAGSQLAEAAYKAGFPRVFCINTSEKDLNNSVVNKSIPCFLAGLDGRGAGMNRKAAQSLFSKNYKDLFEKEEFNDLCNSSDVIVVGCSCSGGSGSGIAPVMMKALKSLYPGKIIIFYGIFPRLTASDNELSNSMSCMGEIEALMHEVEGGFPYMLANLDVYEGVSNEIAFGKVIDKMVSDIEVISGKFLNWSKLRMIDENDTRVILSAPGYMSIYRVDGITQQMLDKENAQQLILKQVKRSPAVPIARDGLIERMAFISNMPEDMDDSSKAGDYSEIIKYVGRPVSVFENYALVNGGQGQLIMIISGQSYPVGHMSIVNGILKEAVAAREKAEEARKFFDKSMTDDYRFIEGIGGDNANLLDNKASLSGDDRKSALDNLFG